MDLDKETESQIQELQMLEQNMQAVMMQKQAFQFELSEIENALSELKKTDGEVYKLVGQIMLKKSKEDLQKDLSQKQEMFSVNLKSLENQEKVSGKNLEELRKKVLSRIKK